MKRRDADIFGVVAEFEGEVTPLLDGEAGIT